MLRKIREDEDNKATALGKLREDDESGWVMGTISIMVQQPVERCRQKQMKLDELTQPGWGDAACHISVRDKMYHTTELRFRQLSCRKWMMVQFHLDRQYLMTVWSLLVLSPEYHLYCMEHLDQEVVR